MKHNVPKISAPLASGSETASPYFLNDCAPSERALAIFTYEHNRQGLTKAEAAERLGWMLECSEDLSPDDFEVAIVWREKSLTRLLDADVLALLRKLAQSWSVPVEAVIQHAIQAYQDEIPDPEMIYSTSQYSL